MIIKSKHDRVEMLYRISLADVTLTSQKITNERKEFRLVLQPITDYKHLFCIGEGVRFDSPTEVEKSKPEDGAYSSTKK